MVTIKNNLPAFAQSSFSVLNDALKEGARDILVKAKHKAPFQKGALRAQSDTHQVGMLHQRVSFWMEYARFQEFGGDRSRRVRRYTTSGTGKGFLKSSGDEVARMISSYFRKHSQRTKLWT